jgi:transposase, IS30 family
MAQLNMEEREVISQMFAAGHSRKAIAERLGRPPCTIGREVKRNARDVGGYSALEAQRKTEVRRRERPLTRKLQQPELNAAVRSYLTQEWSPEQIAGRLKLLRADDPRFHVAPQTIYTWIEQNRDSEHWKTFLRRGGRRQKSPRAGRIPRQVQIDGRPEEANQRLRLGDFEGDTIVSCGKRSGLVTLVDRKSRYLLAAKLKDRTATRTREKIERLLAPLPAEKRQTMTFDNGKEFAEHELLAQRLGLEVFFAHPYASWERGTSENTNRLLRQYYPKGTDFADVSHYDLTQTVKRINDRPRKSLNYQTPSEVFHGIRPAQSCN